MSRLFDFLVTFIIAVGTIWFVLFLPLPRIIEFIILLVVILIALERFIHYLRG